MKALDIFVTLLLIIGGINWGLIGFFNINLVAAILGEGTAWTRVVYALVGLCAVYEAVGLKAIKERWCAFTTTPLTTVPH